MDFEEIERELKVFEAEERKRLGIEEEKVQHWHDANPQTFTHTGSDDNASTWWVDLGAPAEIRRIILWNRADCCQTRFRDLTVNLLAPDGKTVDGNKHPGLARQSGHLSFLGHGSRVEFRNLRVKELEKK